MVKGEIWWANLPAAPYGSEPGKRRPVLIIQNDAFNRSAIQTTALDPSAPLTTPAAPQGQTQQTPPSPAGGRSGGR